jgi:pimeloyl-ACP methyl ester carboxylesterase
VILLNSGLIHRVGVSRLHVGFARAFAAAGITTLRFDLSGIGDSERQSETLSLQESVKRDIAEALAFLSTECGAASFVLIGLCSGAYDAFQVALRDPRVSGAVLIDIPGPFQTWRHIAHHLRARVFRWRSWRNPIEKLVLYARTLIFLSRSERREYTPDFVQGVRPRASFKLMQAELDTLLTRNVELYFIFTSGVPSNYNHRMQFRHRFPRAAAHRALRVDFMPESNHTFSAQSARARVTGLVRDWMLRPGGLDGSSKSSLLTSA